MSGVTLTEAAATVNLFSMSAAVSLNLDYATLARFGVLQGTEALLPERAVLGLDWPELERVLPDHGLPRGVIELAAMPRLTGASSRHQGAGEWLRGGTTSIAIAAIRSLHASDEHAWAAWITAEGTNEKTDRRTAVPPVYAPALAQAGVDLDRLLIVRPPPQAIARTVVKVAASGAFGLVVVDAPHRQDLSGGVAVPLRDRQAGGDASAVVVRKLALAAEESGTTTLLLTNGLVQRSIAWPVALRLEVERRPDALSIRVTKDRRGCGSSQQVVRLAS